MALRRPGVAFGFRPGGAFSPLLADRLSGAERGCHTRKPAHPVADGLVGDKPRLGFWVAPDNQSDGEMDDALVMAATRSREELVKAGETFIASAEEEAPGKWTEKRSKALLGVEMGCLFRQLRNGLDSGRTGADDTHLLAREIDGILWPQSGVELQPPVALRPG